MSKSPPEKRKRLTLVPRVDLIDRIQEKADLLQQGTNNFANLCIEGVLDAMDSTDSHEIPILSLYNRVAGKTFLTSKAVMAIAGAFVPQVHEIDRHEQEYLMELINKNKGSMSADTFRGYCKLAKRMNMERIERERELEDLEKNNTGTE